MNTKDSLRLGAPLGEAARRAVDLVWKFIRGSAPEGLIRRTWRTTNSLSLKHPELSADKGKAWMIAFEFAVARGLDVTLGGDVQDIMKDDWWWVFLPYRVPRAESSAVFVRIHKQTGEVRLENENAIFPVPFIKLS